MERCSLEVMDVGVLAPNIVDIVVRSQEEIKKIVEKLAPLCDAVFSSEDRSLIILKSGVLIMIRRPRVIQTVR